MWRLCSLNKRASSFFAKNTRLMMEPNKNEEGTTMKQENMKAILEKVRNGHHQTIPVSIPGEQELKAVFDLEYVEYNGGEYYDTTIGLYENDELWKPDIRILIGKSEMETVADDLTDEFLDELEKRVLSEIKKDQKEEVPAE